MIQANKSVSLNKCTFQVRKKIKLALEKSGVDFIISKKETEGESEKNYCKLIRQQIEK